jgi:glycerophosphoryl diester phosphodiesterase
MRVASRVSGVPRQPAIIAHRGASGRAPENSLEAVRLAVEAGADGVEIDVHASRDGALVVHHDPALPGLGLIRELDLVRVREYRLSNGEPPPGLEEVLAAAGPLRVWVEVKDLAERWDGRLLETLDAGPHADRYAVHAFDHGLVARLGAHRPSLPRGVLLRAPPADPGATLRAAGATTLWQEWPTVTESLVRSVHLAGAEVVAWTVNDGLTARALAAMSVDGLCGNWPERLRIA